MGSKSKILSLMIVLVFLTSLVLLPHATVKAQTRTLVVPDQYTTIQDAINNASAGDTVLVKQGTYYTYVNSTYQLTINKPLSLIGENPANTILDGTNKSRIYTGESIYHPYVSLSYINITSSDVTIANFTIKNCDTGIILTDSNQPISRVDIVGNNILNCSNNSGSFYGDGNAIFCWAEENSKGEASNILISQNNIQNNSGLGIFISGQKDDNFVISYNNIDSNVNGIQIDASNSLIEGNNIYQNWETGLTLVNCSNVTVKNNTLNNNGIANFFAQYYGYLEYSGGLQFVFCQSCFVYGNNITNNHRYGITFEGVNNSIVENNDVLDNGAGIRLVNYVYYGRLLAPHGLGIGNLVYDNNLVGNTPNALVDSFYSFNMPDNALGNGTDSVSWDNGTVGNFWGDYNGQGAYVIGENNIDYHPLTQQVNVSLAVPEFSAMVVLPLLLFVFFVAVVFRYRQRVKKS